MNAGAVSAQGRSSSTRRSWRLDGYSLLIIPPALAAVLFFAYPLLDLMAMSFSSEKGPFATYAGLLQDDLVILSFANTIKFAVLVAALATLLGYPVALLIASVNRTTAGILLLIVLIPFWTSVLVRSYAWIVILGRRGIVNTALMNLGLVDQPVQFLFNSFGVIVGMVHVMLPYAVLPILSSITKINKDVLWASDGLGASRFQTFRRVLFPLTLPGVLGGAALVIVLSFGFFITPTLMGGSRDIVAAKVIHEQITQQLAWDKAAAVSVLIFVMTAGTFLLCAKVFGLGKHMTIDAR